MNLKKSITLILIISIVGAPAPASALAPRAATQSLGLQTALYDEEIELTMRVMEEERGPDVLRAKETLKENYSHDSILYEEITRLVNRNDTDALPRKIDSEAYNNQLALILVWILRHKEKAIALVAKDSLLEKGPNLVAARALMLDLNRTDCRSHVTAILNEWVQDPTVESLLRNFVNELEDTDERKELSAGLLPLPDIDISTSEKLAAALSNLDQAPVVEARIKTLPWSRDLAGVMAPLLGYDDIAVKTKIKDLFIAKGPHYLAVKDLADCLNNPDTLDIAMEIFTSQELFTRVKAELRRVSPQIGERGQLAIACLTGDGYEPGISMRLLFASLYYPWAREKTEAHLAQTELDLDAVRRLSRVRADVKNPQAQASAQRLLAAQGPADDVSAEELLELPDEELAVSLANPVGGRSRRQKIIGLPYNDRIMEVLDYLLNHKDKKVNQFAENIFASKGFYPGAVQSLLDHASDHDGAMRVSRIFEAWGRSDALDVILREALPGASPTAKLIINPFLEDRKPKATKILDLQPGKDSIQGISNVELIGRLADPAKANEAELALLSRKATSGTVDLIVDAFLGADGQELEHLVNIINHRNYRLSVIEQTIADLENSDRRPQAEIVIDYLVLQRSDANLFVPLLENDDQEIVNIGKAVLRRPGMFNVVFRQLVVRSLFHPRARPVAIELIAEQEITITRRTRLEDALPGADPETAEAIRGLLGSGSSGAKQGDETERLIAKLKDPSRRDEARIELMELRHCPESASVILGLLSDDDPEVRKVIKEVLIERGPHALIFQTLLDILEDPTADLEIVEEILTSPKWGYGRKLARELAGKGLLIKRDDVKKMITRILILWGPKHPSADELIKHITNPELEPYVMEIFESWGTCKEVIIVFKSHFNKGNKEYVELFRRVCQAWKQIDIFYSVMRQYADKLEPDPAPAPPTSP